MSRLSAQGTLILENTMKHIQTITAAKATTGLDSITGFLSDAFAQFSSLLKK